MTTKLDFTQSIDNLREVLEESPENTNFDQFYKAITLLMTAQSSGLSLDEILLLLKGNVAKRLANIVVDSFFLEKGSKWAISDKTSPGELNSCLTRLVEDLAPTPELQNAQQEAKQEGK